MKPDSHFSAWLRRLPPLLLAAKGGSLGLVNGLLETLVETTRQPAPGPYGAAATLIVGVILTTVSTTMTAILGGMQAVPSKTADAAERQLNATFGRTETMPTDRGEPSTTSCIG